MKKKQSLIFALTLAMLLSSCGGQTAEENGAQSGEVPVQGEASQTFPGDGTFPGGQSGAEAPAGETRETVVIDTETLFSDRDFETDYAGKKSAVITLNGSTASCDSDAVQINGGTVTITDEGTYILSGTLEDGQIIVNAGKDDKTQLVLNGVSVHSETSAPIYVRQADKVFVTLAEGSENTLSNGGSFTAIDENNIDAVVFSKEDITFNGAGSLTVNSPAGHGIVSKDSLTVTGGSYHIAAASHGLDGKDDLAVADGTFVITAGKDGIHAEHDEDLSLGYLYIRGGNFDITADGDGLSASASVQIDDGTFRIVSGGGSENAPKKASGFGGFGGGMRPGAAADPAAQTAETADTASGKGIKGAAGLFINGGTFTIDAADDAVHSNTDASICGGVFAIATGDDGFHADQTLTVTAGTIDISACYEGLEGLHIEISGGEIRAKASDDGLNAAGGMDASGFGGFGGGDMFAGRGGMPENISNIPVMNGNMPADAERPAPGGFEKPVDGTAPANGEFTPPADGAKPADGSFEKPEDGTKPAEGAMPAPGMGGMPGGAGMFPGGRNGGSAPNEGSAPNGGMQGGMGAMPGGSSGGSILISGGTIHLNAGGDCIDANGTLEITGGTVTVCSAMSGDTSVLDFDRSATITGGVFVGSGSAMMAHSFSASEQGVITLRLGSTQTAGTEIRIEDAEGRLVFSYAPEQDYYYLVISTPELVKGGTYSVSAGTFGRTLQAD